MVSGSSDLLERKRLRVAVLGVGGSSGGGSGSGGGRLWLLAMLARKVEQYSPEPSRMGDRMGGGVYGGGRAAGCSGRRTGERRLLW